MPRQIALNVLADGDDPELARSRVIERVANERGCDTLALVFRRHLGMHEGDATVLDDVLEEAGELVTEVRLVTGTVGRVGHDGVGSVGHGRDAKRSGPRLRPEDERPSPNDAADEGAERGPTDASPRGAPAGGTDLHGGARGGGSSIGAPSDARRWARIGTNGPWRQRPMLVRSIPEEVAPCVDRTRQRPRRPGVGGRSGTLSGAATSSPFSRSRSSSGAVRVNT